MSSGNELGDKVNKAAEAFSICARCGMSFGKHQTGKCPDGGGIFRPQLDTGTIADAAETLADVMERGPSMLLGRMLRGAKDWAVEQIMNGEAPPPPPPQREGLVKNEPVQAEYTPPKRK